MKLISWNVNGLRAIKKKGVFDTFVAQEQPDILCLQEIKAAPHQVEVDLKDYHEIWHQAQRPGYAGTAIFVKEGLELVGQARKNFSDAVIKRYGESMRDQFGDLREEGRFLMIELNDFFLINVYVPNAKEPDLKRLKMREDVWDPALLLEMKTLAKQKPVVLCGDFNVAHAEIDLARPEANRGHAGFTDAERKGMDNYLAAGWTDSFRRLYPEKVQYSWWSYRGGARKRNVGWRIDYFLLSKCLEGKLKGAGIYDNVMGSDHAPIWLELETSKVKTQKRGE